DGRRLAARLAVGQAVAGAVLALVLLGVGPPARHLVGQAVAELQGGGVVADGGRLAGGPRPGDGAALEQVGGLGVAAGGEPGRAGRAASAAGPAAQSRAEACSRAW